MGGCGIDKVPALLGPTQTFTFLFLCFASLCLCLCLNVNLVSMHLWSRFQRLHHFKNSPFTHVAASITLGRYSWNYVVRERESGWMWYLFIAFLIMNNLECVPTPTHLRTHLGFFIYFSGLFMTDKNLRPRNYVKQAQSKLWKTSLPLFIIISPFFNFSTDFSFFGWWVYFQLIWLIFDF